MQDILLSKDEFIAFLREDRGKRANSQAGLSPPEFVTPLIVSEAARFIGCVKFAIAILVSKGHISAQRMGNALWVDPRSLSRFGSDYLPVRSVAKERRTSFRVLARVLERQRFSMIVCRMQSRRKKELFIKVHDRDSVVDIFRAWEESSNVHLLKRDRQRITQILSIGGGAARVLRHALILRQLGDGHSAAQVIASVSVTARTVRGIARLYREEGLDSALHGKPRKKKEVELLPEPAN